jgi:hypothetical protein
MFRTKYFETKKFDKSALDLFDLSVKALDKCSFRVVKTDKDNKKILATVGISFASWGENISVEIDDDANLSIVSKLAFPLQIIDWGKNRQNVNKFFTELQKIIDNK